jgi:hypothetical protein
MTSQIHDGLSIAVDDQLATVAVAVRNIETDSSLEKPRVTMVTVRKRDFDVDHVEARAGVETAGCEAERDVESP